jgi:hypothetical protein|tara:strand:- start:926 stop:1123 length:198 start_codon:yes stop_codon:yes gene_type:complete
MEIETMNIENMVLDSFQCAIDKKREENEKVKHYKAVVVIDFFAAYSQPVHVRIYRAWIRFLDRVF